MPVPEKTNPPIEKPKGLEEKLNPQQKEQQKLLKLSEISLWLDNYDDIFSDFDPRPYTERALSEDFLAETKRACRDKVSGQVELKFLVPRAVRNTFQESLIKKRMREHFKKHHGLIEKERKDVIKQGLYFATGGIILMFVAAAVIFASYGRNLLVNFLIVLLEPAGWFLFWEGLNQVVFESKKKKPEVDFYTRMSEAEFTFVSY